MKLKFDKIGYNAEIIACHASDKNTVLNVCKSSEKNESTVIIYQDDDTIVLTVDEVKALRDYLNIVLPTLK